MNTSYSPAPLPSGQPVTTSVAPRRSWKRTALIIVGIVLGTVVLTAAVTVWWVKHNFYASSFSPVQLSANEKVVLDEKLQILQHAGAANIGELPPPVQPPVGAGLPPPAQSQPASPPQQRTLVLTDREINAFLERQGLGEQIKVSLHNGGGTATFLLPIGENDKPGQGATLRIGVSLNAMMDANHRFTLSMSDLSVGGISLPNAWLGNAKGVNMLSDEQLMSDPAFQAFVAGIRDFAVQNGQIRVTLNE